MPTLFPLLPPRDATRGTNAAEIRRDCYVQRYQRSRNVSTGQAVEIPAVCTMGLITQRQQEIATRIRPLETERQNAS
jgi:hypothetical protein